MRKTIAAGVLAPAHNKLLLPEGTTIDPTTGWVICMSCANAYVTCNCGRNA